MRGQRDKNENYTDEKQLRLTVIKARRWENRDSVMFPTFKAPDLTQT